MSFLSSIEGAVSGVVKSVENAISPPAAPPPVEDTIFVDSNGNWWAGNIGTDGLFHKLEPVYNPSPSAMAVPGHAYQLPARSADGTLGIGADLGVKTAAGHGKRAGADGLGSTPGATVGTGISNGAIAAIGVGSVLALGLAAWALSKANEPGGAMASGARTYYCTTQWGPARGGWNPGNTFERIHERVASSAEEATELERAHNDQRMLGDMGPRDLNYTYKILDVCESDALASTALCSY